MKTKIYATFDKLTCELNQKTFNAPNNDVAKQAIINSMYNPQTGEMFHEIKRTAKNYKVCLLGEFDTENGLTGLGTEFETLWEMEDLVKEEIAKGHEIQDTTN